MFHPRHSRHSRHGLPRPLSLEAKRVSELSQNGCGLASFLATHVANTHVATQRVKTWQSSWCSLTTRQGTNISVMLSMMSSSIEQEEKRHPACLLCIFSGSLL
jgi:hypothetical protein